MKHLFSIPGLDRAYCRLCKKWIVSETELLSLQKATEKIKEEKARKEWQSYLKKIEFDYLNCKQATLGESL